MNTKPQTGLFQNRKRILAAIFLCLAAGYGLHAYLVSPYRVVQRTFSALNGRDAQALVDLSSRKEREAMNLDSATVAAFLKKTWWREGAAAQRVAVKGCRWKYANLGMYSADVTGFGASEAPRPAYVYVYRDSSGSWRLNLSMLLFVLPKSCNGAQGDYAREWDVMARECGIRGVTTVDGRTRWVDGTHSPSVWLSHD